MKSQESGLHNLIEVKAIAKKQQVVWEPKYLSGKLGLVYFQANYQLFVQLGFHQISRTWTKWAERHQTSLSDGAFRLSAFRCARILSPNWRIWAKGINLACFMSACLDLTLYNEKLYRNVHHSPARALRQNTQLITKRSTVCMTEKILHM